MSTAPPTSHWQSGEEATLGMKVSTTFCAAFLNIHREQTLDVGQMDLEAGIFPHESDASAGGWL